MAWLWQIDDFKLGCGIDPSLDNIYYDHERSSRYENDDERYEAAVYYYSSAAEEGSPHAQHRLGVKHYYGEGVSEDNAQAAKWFLRAAKQDYPPAMFMAAHCYEQGIGVHQDSAKAADWYRRVTMHSALWYREAAVYGHAPAQLDLGRKLLDGSEGIPQDYTWAYGWLNLAASQFSASEQVYRDKAVDMRDRAASLLTSRQLARAQRWAHQWRVGVGEYPGRPCEGLVTNWENQEIISRLNQGPLD